MSTKKEHSDVTPTGRQIAAARALLDMSQAQLAAATGLSKGTIVNVETGTRVPTRANMIAIVDALRRRGIRFNNGDAPTVTHLKSEADIP